MKAFGSLRHALIKPLAGRGFRIGHLGDCNPAMILGAIAGVEAALLVQCIPVGAGGTQHAVRHLAQHYIPA